MAKYVRVTADDDSMMATPSTPNGPMQSPYEKDRVPSTYVLHKLHV